MNQHQLWNLTKTLYDQFKLDQTQQGLDTQNLPSFKRDHIKPLYPHNISSQGLLQKYTCKQACCQFQPGRFICCNSTPPDHQFQKLGLGMCLYFKYLKHISFFYLLIGVVSLFSCGACIWVAVDNDFNPLSSLQTFLYSGTMGAFSSEYIHCQYEIVNNSSVQFQVECPYGMVSIIGATYSNQSSNTLYNCKIQQQNYLNSIFVVNGNIVQNCTDNACSASITINNTSNPFRTIAYSYQCLDQKYTLGSISVSSSALIYFVVALDMLTCVLFVVFYITQLKSEAREIQYFKQQNLSLDDFSWKITGFTQNNFQKQFDGLVGMLRDRLGYDCVDQLVQVKVPDRQDLISYQQRKTQAYYSLFQFMRFNFFDKQVSPHIYKSLQDMQFQYFTSVQQSQKFTQDLTTLVTKYIQITYKPTPLSHRPNLSIYLVLGSLKIKRLIYQLQRSGCFNNYLQVQGRQYKISQPPAPDLIMWHNKGKRTLLRTIFSWIMTLLICVISYIIFGLIQLAQNQLLSQYDFDINCAILYPNVEFITYDNPTNDPDYHSCFCLQNLLQFDNPSYQLCGQWRTQYAVFLAIPIIISLLLVIYNIVVGIFFKMLTTFQKHRLMSDHLFSYTIKRSFLLIMNMGLVMILINMKYNNQEGIQSVSFLLQGKYTDLTPDWYMNIGSIIIMTMIFNIAFPIIQLLLASVVKCMRRCWDQRCICRVTSCLYSSDIYPIEERYAFLISTLIITLSFSCVIPLLNIICFISLFLLYFADRLLIFKLYQTPPNYGNQLHRLVRKGMYLGLVAHMALSAVFLSQPLLVAGGSQLTGDKAVSIGDQRIDTMLNVYYIIPYTALFLVLAAWGLLNNTIIALYRRCVGCCKQQMSQISTQRLQLNFYDILSQFQLLKLKTLIQAQLNKLNKGQSNDTRQRKKDMSDMSGRSLQTSFIEGEGGYSGEHQSLLRKTLERLNTEQGIRKNGGKKSQVFLFGLPGYEMMLDDEKYKQNKKNAMLHTALWKHLKGDQEMKTVVKKEVSEAIRSDQI